MYLLQPAAAWLGQLQYYILLTQRLNLSKIANYGQCDQMLK